MRILILSLSIAVLTGCASSQPRIAQTLSGRPEITLNTSNMELVKGAIISEMQTRGCALQSDSNYLLSFSKQMFGLNAALTQIAIGNQYSTTPNENISFTLSKIGQTVRVVAFCSVSTQMVFGQTQSADMSGNNAWFNELQRILYAVQEDVNREIASAEPPAPKPGESTTATKNYSDGSRYVGEMKNGRRNGSGVMTWPSGSKYVGEWIDGEQGGEGTYIWAEGDKYVGHWSKGKRDGTGTMTYTNGAIKAGMWKNGAFVETSRGTPPQAANEATGAK